MLFFYFFLRIWFYVLKNNRYFSFYNSFFIYPQVCVFFIVFVREYGDTICRSTLGKFYKNFLHSIPLFVVAFFVPEKRNNEQLAVDVCWIEHLFSSDYGKKKEKSSKKEFKEEDNKEEELAPQEEIIFKSLEKRPDCTGRFFLGMR